eukprot:CAMPEP_0179136294 /NCGR_PEP_ID=MMETSP0796-20121207/64940_1 /TAXON_ID=73915 /ORGANISM="Pyrodinium bahamense, Strain pbaha01" /LENGTH=74 /DNA_ID=CAMNT_0020835369 /DNA_START=64 /DNA_END=284 /DNA_ORIENTATION=-
MASDSRSLPKLRNWSATNLCARPEQRGTAPHGTRDCLTGRPQRAPQSAEGHSSRCRDERGRAPPLPSSEQPQKV